MINLVENIRLGSDLLIPASQINNVRGWEYRYWF